MTRKERLTQGITKEMKGLEIGPSINPVVPKKEGYQVETIDHTDRQGLIDKYLTDENSKDKIHDIEEVDYVWHGGSYLELTNRPDYYDYILASHVIEHTVDMIGFLLDCEAMLKNQGVLILAVPDKRFSFDYYKPVTTVGQLIDAHERDAMFHSYGNVVDHFLHAVTGGIRTNISQSEGTDCWGNYNVLADELLYPKHNLKTLESAFKQAKEQKEYVDIHRYTFTPASFELLIHELSILNLIHFKAEFISEAIGYEFIVRLKKDTHLLEKHLDSEEELKYRFSLMNRIKEEDVKSDFIFLEQKLPGSLTSSLKMHYSIDECYYENGTLFVRGWAFIEDCDTDTQLVYLSIVDRRKKERHFYPLVKTLRPDVSSRMESTKYELSGFIGFIPMQDAEDYYMEAENMELFISFEEHVLIGNDAMSNYKRITEPKLKKVLRKIVKK